MKILCFTQTDNIKEIILVKTKNILESLSEIDGRNVKLITQWRHDNATLECYGCDTNIHNEKINTHNLPPSDLSYILYGDIYLVYKINNMIIELDIPQYGMMTYYIEERYENTESSGQIDEITSDEDIEENTDEIIEVSKKPPKKKISNTCDKILDELDYDNTNY